jgi:hypothetical protein
LAHINAPCGNNPILPRPTVFLVTGKGRRAVIFIYNIR